MRSCGACGSAPRRRSARRPARVVVEGADGPYVVADAGPGAPVVQEIVERLGARSRAAYTATVFVPLKEGAIERVRELVGRARPSTPQDAPNAA